MCGVNIIDDDILEDNEALTVTLNASEIYVVLGNNETTVTIVDNDGKYSLSIVYCFHQLAFFSRQCVSVTLTECVRG